MNSKKCKQLRQMIYNGLSQRVERTYITIGHPITVDTLDKNGVKVKKRVIANQTMNHPESLRGKYLQAKRLYKLRKRG